MMVSRPRTPDRINPDGSTTVTIQRACNRCRRLIGDVTLIEIDCAIDGRLLPDVSHECGCACTDS